MKTFLAFLVLAPPVLLAASPLVAPRRHLVAVTLLTVVAEAVFLHLFTSSLDDHTGGGEGPAVLAMALYFGVVMIVFAGSLACRLLWEAVAAIAARISRRRP